MHATSDTAPLRTDHRAILALELALGSLGLIAAFAAVATATESVHRDTRVVHDVVILGARFTYPVVNAGAAVLLLLAALGLAALASASRDTFRHFRAHRRFMSELSVLGPLPGYPGVAVMSDPTPQAFCAGYLRPRVYVSAGAVELLAEDELAAVIRHEQHHRRARDPLRFACARALSHALFFVPALRPLGDRYSELAELRADDAAVQAAGGRRGPIASALLAFDAAVPPGSAGIAAERVDSLLGVSRPKPLPRALIGVSAATLAALIAILWRASGVASAHSTFNLPLISSQPCVLVLALLPLATCVGAFGARHLVSADRLADR